MLVLVLLRNTISTAVPVIITNLKYESLSGKRTPMVTCPAYLTYSVYMILVTSSLTGLRTSTMFIL